MGSSQAMVDRFQLAAQRNAVFRCSPKTPHRLPKVCHLQGRNSGPRPCTSDYSWGSVSYFEAHFSFIGRTWTGRHYTGLLASAANRICRLARKIGGAQRNNNHRPPIGVPQRPQNLVFEAKLLPQVLQNISTGLGACQLRAPAPIGIPHLPQNFVEAG